MGIRLDRRAAKANYEFNFKSRFVPQRRTTLMKKLIIRIGIVVALVVFVALVVVFFSLNSIVKKGVETVGPDLTKVQVRLGAADLSPFSGGGKLSQLFVGNPDGYKTQSAIEIGSIRMGVKIGSVLSDTVVIDEVNIQAPQLTLESTLSGKSNLSKILDNLSASNGSDATQKPAATAAKKSEKKFIVKDLVVEGAKVNLAVSGLGQLPTVTLPTLHLQNIGSENNGVTASELVQQVMKPLLESAIDAGAKAIASSSKDVQKLGKDAMNQLKGATKGIGDLLKKN
jgi:hypothetical protein